MAFVDEIRKRKKKKEKDTGVEYEELQHPKSRQERELDDDLAILHTLRKRRKKLSEAEKTQLTNKLSKRK